MAKNAPVVDGLLDSETTLEQQENEKKARKEQTPDERDVLEAGTSQMGTMGITDNLKKVLELVPYWNGEKDSLQAKKDEVIKSFGDSNKLKDYIDGAFQEEIKAFNGIAKTMPVLNNIKAFYARRDNAGKGKVKFVQVSISGITYLVNATYRDEIASLPGNERKELLLAHADTKKADIIEEII